jgi:23S rRNA G2069 N7-methylase RlmK/C1962 C5-methylase RlmI
MNKKHRNQNTDKIWLKQIMESNDFNDIKIKFVKEDVFQSHMFIMNT